LAPVPALSVRDLTVRRGLLEAVRHVDLELFSGRLTAILGLNGAGKSSLLLALAGALPVASGTVELEGIDLTNKSSWDCCGRGLVCVPAGRQLFPGLTVMENLQVGAHLQRDRRRIEDNAQRVFGYFPILAERRKQRAGELSGGQQQMLAIGRGLMADPKVLLLDEPSEGLAPLIVDQVFDTISTLAVENSIAVLLAEQNASALNVCDTVCLMRDGELSPPESADRAENERIARYVFGAEPSS
jgi:branched-chain amino acid transport system ATP-binding protein